MLVSDQRNAAALAVVYLKLYVWNLACSEEYGNRTLPSLNRTTEESHSPSPTVGYVPARPERSGAKSKGAESRPMHASTSMSGFGRQCANVVWFDLATQLRFPGV